MFSKLRQKLVLIKVGCFTLTLLCFLSFMNFLTTLNMAVVPEQQLLNAKEPVILYYISEYDAHVKAYEKHKTSKKDVEALCKVSKDCELLSKVVLYEARGEPLEGQRAVAAVVINRVKDEKFPDTVKDVVYQRHQFSFVKDMHKQTQPTQKDVARARKVAYNVLHGKVKSPVGKALYFHTTAVKPVWSKNKVKRKIGNHLFF